MVRIGPVNPSLQKKSDVASRNAEDENASADVEAKGSELERALQEHGHSLDDAEQSKSCLVEPSSERLSADTLATLGNNVNAEEKCAQSVNRVGSPQVLAGEPRLDTPSNARSDPLECVAGVKASCVDPLTAIKRSAKGSSEKEHAGNQTSVVDPLKASCGPLGFSPSARAPAAQAAIAPAAASKPSAIDPLRLFMAERKEICPYQDEQTGQHAKIASPIPDLTDVAGTLGRRVAPSTAPAQEVSNGRPQRSLPSTSEATLAEKPASTVSAKDAPVDAVDRANFVTSLQDFLGEFIDDIGSPQDGLEGHMSESMGELLSRQEELRWSEQTVEVLENETLTIGPFGPSKKCEILSAWFGVSPGHTVDITDTVRKKFEVCTEGALSIKSDDLGEEVHLEVRRHAQFGLRVLGVRFRMQVRGHDVSSGKYREGVGRVGNVVPIVTKALANVVGATLAASGYAVAKAEVTVRNRFLEPDGQRHAAGGDKDIADSKAFQTGFNAWLTLNGIKPSVAYEPTGKAGVRLLWLYSQTAAPGEVPRTVPPAEDIRQTPLLVANHISYIDALVLAVTFGAPKVLAKSGTLKTPLIGTFAKEIGVIEVDRSSRDSRAATMESIASHVAGWRLGERPLLLFPEGTTSNGADLLEFKKGAFVAGAPVRPIVICYDGAWHPANVNYKVSKDGEITPTGDKEWCEQFLGHFIHSLSVKVLPPYIPSEEEKGNAMIFASNVRGVMSDAYARMKIEAEAKAAQKEKGCPQNPLARVSTSFLGR